MVDKCTGIPFTFSGTELLIFGEMILNYLNNEHLHKKMPKLIDGSRQPERIARESLNQALQKEGISYCSDKGDLIWLALPRKIKRYLEKRSIQVAKDTRGFIIVFKSGDEVDNNRKYCESYHFNEAQIGNDHFAFSNLIEPKDYRFIARHLDIPEIAQLEEAAGSSLQYSIKAFCLSFIQMSTRTIKREFGSLFLLPAGQKNLS